LSIAQCRMYLLYWTVVVSCRFILMKVKVCYVCVHAVFNKRLEKFSGVHPTPLGAFGASIDLDAFGATTLAPVALDLGASCLLLDE